MSPSRPPCAKRRGRAVAVLVAASLALLVTAGCSAIGVSRSDATAHAMVDVYSGRPNPVVQLSGAATEDLFSFIERHAASAVPADEPPSGLGFRGLMVTIEHPDLQWSGVRVLPEAVYVYDGANPLRIPDDTGEAFRVVWGDISGRLDAEVVSAVEDVE